MGVYAGVEDIKSMFRSLKIEASGTVVTTDEVNDFIDEDEALLDAKLDTYYVTPITGAKSLLIMKKIIKLKVAHTIKGILEVKEPEADLTNDVQGNLYMMAEKIIKDLLPQPNKKTGNTERPVAPLPDAVARPTSPASGSVFASNPSVNTPTISKGGNNW